MYNNDEQYFFHTFENRGNYNYKGKPELSTTHFLLGMDNSNKIFPTRSTKQPSNLFKYIKLFSFQHSLSDMLPINTAVWRLHRLDTNSE